MNQLSLFTPKFDERVRRVVKDGVTYFSILDVFQHYGSDGSAKDPSKYWERAHKRLVQQAGDTLTGLSEYQFVGSDGRRKAATPIATFRFFLRLAQVVEIQEWEPLRQWMADVAHERIEEAANPELGISRAQARARLAWERQGKDQRWIAERTEGVVARNIFTDALKQFCANPDYPVATDEVYKGVFGMVAEAIRERLKIPKRANLRDHLSQTALAYLRIAEYGIADQLELAGQVMTWVQVRAIIVRFAELVGKQVDEMSLLTGRDALTGRPLLTD